jgi:hypothetical protein
MSDALPFAGPLSAPAPAEVAGFVSSEAAAAGQPILEIDDLSISFFTRTREIPAVMSFSCSVMPGEAVGLVGESGCGKSTVALGVMQDLGVNGRSSAAPSASRAATSPRCRPASSRHPRLRDRHDLPGAHGLPEPAMTVGRSSWRCR